MTLAVNWLEPPTVRAASITAAAPDPSTARTAVVFVSIHSQTRRTSAAPDASSAIVRLNPDFARTRPTRSGMPAPDDGRAKTEPFHETFGVEFSSRNSNHCQIHCEIEPIVRSAV
jgi:hypothetical protein